MKRLIDVTMRIMKELEIEIRPRYKDDGQIQFRAWDQILGINALYRIDSDIKGIINPDSPC